MDRFNCQRRNRYLEAIDTLREIGLGSDISLPQLVVVGDQVCVKPMPVCMFPI